MIPIIFFSILVIVPLIIIFRFGINLIKRTAEDSIKESKLNVYKNIIGICAIVLCVLFFVMPLVGNYSWFSNSSATGWDFVVGKGDFYRNPIIILLLIFPGILAFLAITKKSFLVLIYTSILCLISKIIYLFIANNLLNSHSGELTGNNWVILFIYLGICIFSIYCSKNVKQINETMKKCPFCANEIKNEAIYCQFCKKDLKKD